MSGNTSFADGVGIVDAVNLNIFVQTAQTAAQLRSFVGVVPQTVNLLGIASPGDGLGGVYYWANGTAFVDNNSSVIVPSGAAGAGAWLLAGMSFLPLAGGTLTGPLFGVTATFSGAISGQSTLAILGSATFNGPFVLPNLSTSNFGLAAWTVWNNGGFLCVA
jgi:hypothetical protein